MSLQSNTTPNVTFDPKSHWDAVYSTKGELEVSWYQDEPRPSLDLILEVAAPQHRIIDIGGGTSSLVDRLLDLGFQYVSILDISDVALSRAKVRLGVKGNLVSWIASDVTKEPLLEKVDLWHDRAVFHFLVSSSDRARYVALAEKTINPGGHLIIGGFALDGPEKCSGLPVYRHDSQSIAAEFREHFTLKKSLSCTHMTPWGKKQNFSFAVLERRK